MGGVGVWAGHVRRRAEHRALQGLHTLVDVTPLFSLRENAIAKEPVLRYAERWRCVSRLGASVVVQTLSSLPRM
jgi:hypothetical protein